MDNLYIAGAIAVIGLVTFLLRALPFMIGRKIATQAFALYIKDRFPLVMMFILVVYSSGVVKMQSLQAALPMGLAILITAVLHLFLRNFLLSILVGVVSYVLILHIS